jgi:hypothetical protein
MTQFIRPEGINFSCSDDLSAPVLSQALCRTVSFLQSLNPYQKLHKYEDWWEHDSLHFYRESVNFDTLFNIINSPRSLLYSMPGDEGVFIGVAPDDSSWYLRFYLAWDDEGFNLLGRFDITVPPALTQRYMKEVVERVNIGMKQQDAGAYYKSIGL